MQNEIYVRIHATDKKMRRRTINFFSEYIKYQTLDDDEMAVTEFDPGKEIEESLFMDATRVFDVVIVVVNAHLDDEGRIVGETKYVYLRGECAFHSERKYLADEPDNTECADKYGNMMDGFCSTWS